jgi:hypothetical protein
MPTYEHEAEFQALCAPGFRKGLEQAGAQLCGWQDIAYGA